MQFPFGLAYGPRFIGKTSRYRAQLALSCCDTTNRAVEASRPWTPQREGVGVLTLSLLQLRRAISPPAWILEKIVRVLKSLTLTQRPGGPT